MKINKYSKHITVASTNLEVKIHLNFRTQADHDQLSFYRDKYNSMFLTNFKNSTRKMQRKRIAFKEIYGVIEQAIKDIKKQN